MCVRVKKSFGFSFYGVSESASCNFFSRILEEYFKVALQRFNSYIMQRYVWCDVELTILFLFSQIPDYEAKNILVWYTCHSVCTNQPCFRCSCCFQICNLRFRYFIVFIYELPKLSIPEWIIMMYLFHCNYTFLTQYLCQITATYSIDFRSEVALQFSSSTLIFVSFERFGVFNSIKMQPRSGWQSPFPPP